jgi:hypothetical protein
VPHLRPYCADENERRAFDRHRREFVGQAKRGFDVKQTLEIIRRPGWTWS